MKASANGSWVKYSVLHCLEESLGTRVALAHSLRVESELRVQ